MVEKPLGILPPADPEMERQVLSEGIPKQTGPLSPLQQQFTLRSLRLQTHYPDNHVAIITDPTTGETAVVAAAQDAITLDEQLKRLPAATLQKIEKLFVPDPGIISFDLKSTD